jgi:hypothetical protein
MQGCCPEFCPFLPVQAGPRESSQVEELLISNNFMRATRLTGTAEDSEVNGSPPAGTDARKWLQRNNFSRLPFLTHLLGKRRCPFAFDEPCRHFHGRERFKLRAYGRDWKVATSRARSNWRRGPRNFVTQPRFSFLMSVALVPAIVVAHHELEIRGIQPHLGRFHIARPFTPSRS